MDKYLTIWLAMEPDTWFTAKELGVAPASMTAMKNRNLVKVKDTTPKQYCRIASTAAVLAFLLEKHTAEMSDFISIHRSNEKLAMMCSVKNGKVLDCWGEPYDITTADAVRIGKKWYELIKGREIQPLWENRD